MTYDGRQVMAKAHMAFGHIRVTVPNGISYKDSAEQYTTPLS
jgi:hypothetical protein